MEAKGGQPFAHPTAAGVDGQFASRNFESEHCTGTLVDPLSGGAATGAGTSRQDLRRSPLETIEHAFEHLRSAAPRTLTENAHVQERGVILGHWAWADRVLSTLGRYGLF